MENLKNPVIIRKELKSFAFTTLCGKHNIDNTTIYESRWIDENEQSKEEFQININGKWCAVESIDFDFL